MVIVVYIKIVFIFAIKLYSYLSIICFSIILGLGARTTEDVMEKDTLQDSLIKSSSPVDARRFYFVDRDLQSVLVGNE